LEEDEAGQCPCYLIGDILFLEAILFCLCHHFKHSQAFSRIAPPFLPALYKCDSLLRQGILAHL